MSFRIPDNCSVIVVMGVSGSGKTTVGAMLAGRMGCEFADADDFHSAANVEKMHRGLSLDDTDRLPWLNAIAAQIDAWHADRQCGVVTCSALKRSYRDVIIGKRENVQLVYLRGDQELIAKRMIARQGHFMPVELLASQFAVLEEPAPEERAITVSIGVPPAVLVNRIVEALGDEQPGI
ncbi:MAG TPA: gluconokinase [Gammaproteobacteria bacterium]|nr:gluconokinase [Gammaproteobacteria bacterium]